MDYSKMKKARLIEEIEALREKMVELERGQAERKQAEEALRESKELFQKTFTSQRDALFILDAKTPPTILDCNPAAMEVFGYTRQEMLGRKRAFLWACRSDWRCVLWTLTACFVLWLSARPPTYT